MSPEELAELLKALRSANESRLRREFDRSLPFAEGVFDRWERAAELGFGEGASIYDSAIVLGAVSVGASTWIGPQVLLDGSGGQLEIGSYCSISAGVQIYTHDTVLWALSAGELPKRGAPVGILDRCYIGSQSLVLPGVSIGPQSVVAANSVVNCDVPAGTIVGGSPAKPIGRVEGEGADVRLVYERASPSDADNGRDRSDER